MQDLHTPWADDTNLDILIESRASAVVTLSLGGFSNAEQITSAHITTNDRAITTSSIGISAIPQFLTVFTNTTSISRGQCFVSVWLRVNGVKTILLIQGYITSNNSLSYPNGKIESSVEGSGLIRSITGTDPAAGVNISETVPTGAIWRLLAMRFTLVTDATVANRASFVAFTDGTNEFMRTYSHSAMTASSTYVITIGEFGVRDSSHGSGTFGPTPAGVKLLEGYTIVSVMSNLQAGDNISAPQLLVEEWIKT